MPLLSDVQLALLATFEYMLDREVEPRIGKSLGELVCDADSGLKEYMLENELLMTSMHREFMSIRDWFTLIDALRRDELFCSLELVDFSSDEFGATMAAFRDAENNGYFAFRGTGFGEWQDDAIGAFVADTEQQRRAIEWAASVLDANDFNHVATCGHSKGGNKAMYAVIKLAGRIDHCVSLDGQGFSQQFLDAYAEQIEAYADRIVCYSAADDIVNGLMHPIAKLEHTHFIKEGPLDSPFLGHSPILLFEPPQPGEYALEFSEETERGDFGSLTVDLTDFMENQMTHEDMVAACSFVGRVLDRRLGQRRGDDIEAIIYFDERDELALTLKSLATFTRDHPRGVHFSDFTGLIFGKAELPSWMQAIVERAHPSNS